VCGFNTVKLISEMRKYAGMIVMFDRMQCVAFSSKYVVQFESVTFVRIDLLGTLLEMYTQSTHSANIIVYC
jgi:hypothetical protein